MKKLLTIIFLILLVGFGYKIYTSFSKSVWDGKNRINLVLIDEKISVFSLNSIDRTAVFLSIPQETFIEVIHGYGFYRVGSVFKLGELENHQGGELLASSLQENLGIPIDAYALMVSKVEPSNLKTKDYIFACFRFLLRNGKTNLTKWDLVRLWWGVRKIHQDKIMIVDLKDTEVLIEVVMPDGSRGFEISSEKNESLAQEFFKDAKIREEYLSIVVLNSTAHSGLANRGAKLVKNIGGRVVEIGDWENARLPARQEKSKCEVRSKKLLKKSYTVKKLMSVFNCQKGGEDLGSYRAEVVLIFGEDYWKKLTEKW